MRAEDVKIETHQRGFNDFIKLTHIPTGISVEKETQPFDNHSILKDMLFMQLEHKVNKATMPKEAPPITDFPWNEDHRERATWDTNANGGRGAAMSAGVMSLKERLKNPHGMRESDVLLDVAHGIWLVMEEIEKMHSHPVVAETYPRTINQLEEDAIAETILECDGDLELAAKALGISRATLYRKMKQHGIEAGKYGKL